ncbi:MAG: IPT/TIG domain-containing protein [Planctomycetota bacterium]
MNSAPPLLGCLLPGLLAPLALAQNFNYPDFTSVAGLQMNGVASQVTNTVRLTTLASQVTGSVWYATPVAVAEGFDTTFDFVMTASPEGMAFVIQGSPAGASAVGGDLWGLGYGFGSNTAPITNSLAIEIDALLNTFLNDTSTNEVSVHTCGALGNSENEGVSIARMTPAQDLSNGALQRIRVAYNPGTLTIYINNLVTPAMTVPFTFETGGTQLSGGNTGGLGLGGINAYVGFTSSTTNGVTTQNATLRAWSWTSFFQPPPCYVGNVGVGAGGPYDVLQVNGGIGGFFRVAQLKVADPFSIGLIPPPGQPNSPFVLMATLGIATAATVTTTPWGDLCFPPLVIDIGGALAPYTLNVPGGIFLTLPLTLQAVMMPNPLLPAVLQLTNAVGMQFTLAPAPSITTVTPNSVATGGTMTINGNNFSPFATVDINGGPALPLLTNTATQITFAMPASPPCSATLRVRNPDFAQATAAFNPTPTIINQINTSGPSAGGTTYIVIGTGMAVGTTMTIGGIPATVSSASATAIVVITPPNTPGPKPVVITTPGGCTVNSTFTYL